ncbi:MAG: aminopeptidase N [Rhodocyclaceae bacterium]|nr:MAG: aminopeptidase N [Rhodocyclaceae bacterium]
MKTDTPKTIYLKNYTPPAFWVDTVHLDVDFQPDGAVVTSRLALRRNAAADSKAPLVLDGVELETLALAVDGKRLTAKQYAIKGDTLTIPGLSDACILETLVRIRPDGNTQLSGLYRSADGYFTQCEAQGFRRITWFPDRPDVMARYMVTLHADKATLPVLLGNGNPVASGDEPGNQGRHWATWEDPFPKPCYLFAIVAAKLDVLKGQYTTMSGRKVQLAIYVEPGKLDQCGHAMDALKKSMKWDEETFGLECDLDHYMIVAVGDFNMGAMENKGLNIFNTKYVLARPDVATDVDYENIDRVVGHEYFHNWTGNRVTCRDWFQLTLKEGLTVFRDQAFGADVHSRAVSHIRDVRALRAAQFPEDAGPMAHPIRPASYMEINNFYTATVYQKGAEVIRMIETLIGKASFRKGMDLYFARHDGQAVTCDDFVAAMADASGMDLDPFMGWYEQAGTPRLTARGDYDAGTQRYTLHLSQSCPATPGQDKKQPFLIPVIVGLVGASGADLPLRMKGDPAATKGPTQRVLTLARTRETYVFEAVAEAPVPSLLRGFSAPVVLDYPYSDADLGHLLAHDSDPFNRWEAGQRLAGNLILGAAVRIHQGETPQWPQSFAESLGRVLTLAMTGKGGANCDAAFAAEVLTLPTEATLAEQMDVVLPDALHATRNGLRRFIAEQLEEVLQAAYDCLSPKGSFRVSNAEAGRRALRNVCLGYLCETDTAEGRALALKQFDSADNMTDQFAALAVLAQSEGPERKQALEAFHRQWQQEALVMDKWLTVQATSRRPDTLAEVKALVGHAAFDMRNPNKVYALIRSFGANHVRFHAADGSGYRFLAEQIMHLDAINAQVAARVARSFDRWRKFDAGHQAQARAALEKLHRHSGLSRDVFEIVDRALA